MFEEDSPTRFGLLSALMSVSTYSGREKPQQLGFQASCFYLIVPTLLKKTRKMENTSHIRSTENEHDETPLRSPCSVT